MLLSLIFLISIATLVIQNKKDKNEIVKSIKTENLKTEKTKEEKSLKHLISKAIYAIITAVLIFYTGFNIYVIIMILLFIQSKPSNNTTVIVQKDWTTKTVAQRTPLQSLIFILMFIFVALPAICFLIFLIVLFTAR